MCGEGCVVKGGVVKEGVVKGGSRHPLDPENDTPWTQRQTPPIETTTEVGGMHPTGMHSCFGK